MFAPLFRIWVIGRNTLLESIRQRVLYVILLFGLALLASTSTLSQIAYDQQVKFVKDWGMGIMSVIGLVIALLSTAQLIPQELQNRTLYTILAKPVRRVEFLYGKYLGAILLVGSSMILMTLVFAAVMVLQREVSVTQIDEQYNDMPNWQQNPDIVSSYQQEINHLNAQIYDPQLIAALLLLFAKLVIVQSFALLFSTFATSFIYTVVTTFMVYLAGHLEGVARHVWLHSHEHLSAFQILLVQVVSVLIPDFNSFSIADEILAGNRVPWSQTFELLGYAAGYVVMLLVLSALSFRSREI